MTTAIVLRIQAIGDLARRYGAVFGHAWRERKALDAAPRPSYEVQFLPAALELIEKPVSPAPRAAMWLLIAFALIAVLWAIFGKIDVVATARGKIVPNDRTKVIQPFETSTVKAIHVTDGQEVKAGQVLIELDATDPQADATRLANDLATVRLQGARARALLAAIDSGKPARLAVIADIDAARLAQEQRVLDGQYGEYQAKLAGIDANNAKRAAELHSTEEVVHKLEQTVPIARQRAEDFKGLVDKKFVSRHGYLDKEQQRIEQEGELATQRSRLHELAAALQEGRSQRTALVAGTRRQALDAINDAEQKTTAYEQELIKARSRSGLMTLTAPVDGTVQQLAVHTVGGVVTEAQQLMMVVPKDNQIEIEAFVENKDIGFVNPGQEGQIKIETFPYTKYGTIHAKVISVSTDAVNDEKRGLIVPARVALDRASIQVENKTVNLTPGMAVSVEIKTSERRVIEYFLSPLMQYKDESLRER